MDYYDEICKMVRLRNLSEGTFKTYGNYLGRYLAYTNETLSKKPEEVSWDDLRDYIFYLMDIKKLSPRTVNGHISQLRYFYLYVLRKEWDPYQVPFQKFDTAVRKALTQHEVSEFINGFGNLKQKAVISLMYSSGLRVSEVCRLEYGDVSRRDMTITIKEGKNRSGSIAILSRKALDILTEYWRISDRPREGWLFPGQNGGTHITPETVRRYIKNQISSLGWETDISCHCFRRAFGTHLYQNGVDILVIKYLMRHKSLKSTVAYIYLGEIGKDRLISPFDTYPGLRA